MLIPYVNELHNDELVYGYFQQDRAAAHITGAIKFLTSLQINKTVAVYFN